MVQGTQVLPYVPGFGEQLAQALTGAMGSVGQGLVQGHINRADTKILAHILDPNLTAIERLTLSGKLSDNGQTILTRTLGLESLGERKKQGKRLEDENISKKYDARIKQNNEEIKNSTNKKDRERLKADNVHLKKEQAANSRRLRIGEAPIFDALEGADSAQQPQPATPVQAEQPAPVAPLGAAPAAQTQKFNIQDPNHILRANELLKSVGGDKKKANELLAKEFSL